MTDLAPLGPYGSLVDPATLRLQRLLPGPIERIWAYLTDGELRRRWLAAGEMTLRPGADFEFVWRNDEISDAPSRRPEEFGKEHRMIGQILEVEPSRRLVITWFGESEVVFELTPMGEQVRLDLTHRRLPDRSTLLGVAPGWHTHLDTLAAVAEGRPRAAFWERFSEAQAEYEKRF